MINVLVVEDSPAARELIVYVLGSDPEIRVTGTANDGREAIEAVSRETPDIITMDINMPNMNGLDATRRIMETNPTPIVIVSGSSAVMEVEKSFAAMEAGALAVIQKPRGVGHPDHEKTARELVQTVKLMSEVKVVRRWPRNKGESGQNSPGAAAMTVKEARAEIEVVAIGASTGGPVVLQTILSKLPKNFPAPILIVQHMSAGFLHGMAEWLAQTSGVPLHIAEDGERLLPGHAYFAPDDHNMGVDKKGQISLDKNEMVNGFRPSVSYLFRSVIQVYGKNSTGVLLSGMGRDGAEELKLMKEQGALTIVQDRESSVVYGMPGAAVELDAATYVFSPEMIAKVLRHMPGKKRDEEENGL